MDEKNKEYNTDYDLDQEQQTRMQRHNFENDDEIQNTHHNIGNLTNEEQALLIKKLNEIEENEREYEENTIENNNQDEMYQFEDNYNDIDYFDLNKDDKKIEEKVISEDINDENTEEDYYSENENYIPEKEIEIDNTINNDISEYENTDDDQDYDDIDEDDQNDDDDPNDDQDYDDIDEDDQNDDEPNDDQDYDDIDEDDQDYDDEPNNDQDKKETISENNNDEIIHKKVIKVKPKTTSFIAIIISIIILIVLCILGLKFVKSLIPSRENTNEIAQLINNPKDEIEITTDVPSDWKEYKVSINDNLITLPTPYENIENITKWKVKADYESTTVPKDHYTFLSLYKDEKLALNVDVSNNKEDNLKYNECDVTKITQTQYQSNLGVEKVTFPGNLQVGMTMTKDKLISKIGKPTKIDSYANGTYISQTYKYIENKDETSKNYYSIKIVNGKIEELALDHGK